MSVRKIQKFLAIASLMTLHGCAVDLATDDREVSYEDCSATGLSCRAIAGSYADAGNQKMAERYYILEAQQGDPEFQFVLGKSYLKGETVPKNSAEAEKWLTSAAHKGNVYAQFLLGKEYVSGENFQKNMATALAWYKRAAAQGHVGSLNNLGFLYANGMGVPKNFYIAETYYRRAIEKGNETARQNMQVVAQKIKSTPPETLEAMKKASRVNNTPVAPDNSHSTRNAPSKPAGSASAACTDEALMARFNPEIERIKSSARNMGICQASRTISTLFSRMINETQDCPASAPGIAAFRASLIKERDAANRTAKGTCGD